MKNLDLKECRDKLDVIDKEIVRLFEERMSVCGDVAEYKIGTGKAVYDAGVRNALTGLAAEASVMRILGNY